MSCPNWIGRTGLGKVHAIIIPLLLINLLFPQILFLLVRIVSLPNLTKPFHSLHCSLMDQDGPSPPRAQPSLVPLWDLGLKASRKERFSHWEAGGRTLQQGPASPASPKEESIPISVLPVSPALRSWDLGALSLAVTAGLGQQTLPRVPFRQHSSFHTVLSLSSPLTILFFRKTNLKNNNQSTFHGLIILGIHVFK